MDIIESLTELDPSYDWSLRMIGKGQYVVLCDEKETKYSFYDFTNMFLPTMSDDQKSDMVTENIIGILDRVNKNGVEYKE